MLSDIEKSIPIRSIQTQELNKIQPKMFDYNRNNGSMCEVIPPQKSAKL
jgi:hypothetical protein